MTQNSPADVVDLLQEAWEEGFRVVAEKINCLIQPFGIKVKASKRKGTDSLVHAKRTFCQMWPIACMTQPARLVDNVSDSEKAPWTLGLVNFGHTERLRIGSNIITERDLDLWVAQLAQTYKQPGYTKTLLKKLIVDSVNLERGEWRKTFHSLRGKPNPKPGPKRAKQILMSEEKIYRRFKDSKLTMKAFYLKNIETAVSFDEFVLMIGRTKRRLNRHKAKREIATNG